MDGRCLGVLHCPLWPVSQASYRGWLPASSASPCRAVLSFTQEPAPLSSAAPPGPCCISQFPAAQALCAQRMWAQTEAQGKAHFPPPSPDSFPGVTQSYLRLSLAPGISSLRSLCFYLPFFLVHLADSKSLLTQFPCKASPFSHLLLPFMFGSVFVYSSLDFANSNALSIFFSYNQ